MWCLRYRRRHGRLQYPSRSTRLNHLRKNHPEDRRLLSIQSTGCNGFFFPRLQRIPNHMR